MAIVKMNWTAAITGMSNRYGLIRSGYSSIIPPSGISPNSETDDAGRGGRGREDQLRERRSA